MNSLLYISKKREIPNGIKRRKILFFSDRKILLIGRITKKFFYEKRLLNKKYFNTVRINYKFIKTISTLNYYDAYHYIYLYFNYQLNLKFKWYISLNRICYKYNIIPFSENNNINDILNIGKKILFSFPRYTSVHKHLYSNMGKIMMHIKKAIIITTESSYYSEFNTKFALRKYYLFFKKTKNNFLLTVTDIHGKVILWRSAGHLGLKTKKKKRSFESFDLLCEEPLKKLHKYNISVISKMIVVGTSYLRFFMVRKFFKSVASYDKLKKLKIRRIEFWKSCTHNGIRKKKPKRV